MIVLFTDFGLEGPYVGQMKAVLRQKAPSVDVIDLFADAPAFDVQCAAYLLAAYADEFPPASVFLSVIDPGVGSDRRATLVKANGRFFVGPDNGLFNVVAARADRVSWWDIVWRPARLSASFHGRDLFAPVAAGLAMGEMPPVEEQDPRLRIDPGWPSDLHKVIYLDHYGNAMTGLRAASVARDAVLVLGDFRLHRARTFSDVEVGQAFWYENANGLVEVAVNRGRADRLLGVHVGDAFSVV